MTVSRILAVKGRHVATVAPEQTLHEVSVLLSTKGIGALVVNNTTVTEHYTVDAGTNAQSVGPITVASGVAVTVASGQRWLVV